MTDETEPNRYAFEYPAQSVSSGGTGALSKDQTVLIDEVIDDSHTVASDFTVVNDDGNRIYEAVLGDRTIAGLTYDVVGDDRLVLLAVAVFPEFRKQGVASELIRRVLDDVRMQGKTVTIFCPIVRTFISHNPTYADLVDANHPGVTGGAHRP